MRNDMHYHETTQERRQRFAITRGIKDSYVHGQALCGTGNAHQQSIKNISAVTCSRCLEMIKTCGYDK